MAERKIEVGNEDGRITILEEVLSSVARIAAEKVDGIARSAGSSGGLKSLFGGEEIAPNIRADLGEEGVRIELRISAEYGHPVHEVAQGVQVNVQRDIEALVGVKVIGVDVYVKKVVPPSGPGRGAGQGQ